MSRQLKHLMIGGPRDGEVYGRVLGKRLVLASRPGGEDVEYRLELLRGPTGPVYVLIHGEAPPAVEVWCRIFRAGLV